MSDRSVWQAPLLAAVMWLGGMSTMANDGPDPAAGGSPGCAAPEHRQFDFWIGSWVVTEGGAPAGRNRIEPDLKGCALFESWTAVDGSRGRSVNFYDRARGRWHQSWVDDRGGVLELDGGWSGGSMVLEGERRDPSGGAPARHRIAWTPNADGSVRQHWQVLKNPQREWETVFDGLYQRSP
jgi:hypothetical protein